MMLRITKVAVSVAGLVLVAMVLASCGSGSEADGQAADTSKAAASVPAISNPVTVRHRAGGRVTFGAGYGFVPDDIPYGTYRTRVDAAACNYVAESSKSVDPVIENNSPVSAVVTIDQRVETFHSSGCGPWSNDLTPITRSKVSFGDGTFIVGVDVAPGSYTSPGGASCVWARLPTFGNAIDAIASGVGDAPARTRISASDRGFVSISCGRWRAT